MIELMSIDSRKKLLIFSTNNNFVLAVLYLKYDLTIIPNYKTYFENKNIMNLSEALEWCTICSA